MRVWCVIMVAHISAYANVDYYYLYEKACALSDINCCENMKTGQ